LAFGAGFAKRNRSHRKASQGGGGGNSDVKYGFTKGREKSNSRDLGKRKCEFGGGKNGAP